MKPTLCNYLVPTLSLFFLVMPLSQAQDRNPKDLIAYQYIEEEIDFVKDVWNGDGEVMIGVIDPPAGAAIAHRTPIEDDGSYCTSLYEGQEVIFYAHSFDPLVIKERDRIKRGVFYTGESKFRKSDASDLRTVKCKPVAKTANGDPVPATATLLLKNEAFLWDDHGYAGGSRPTVRVNRVTAPPGEEVVFTNLSRIPYALEVTAAGFIRQELEINPDLSGELDFKEIELVEAPRLKFTFLSRTRQKGESWIAPNESKTRELAANGKASLLFSDARDGLGNKLNLRIRPKEEGIEASFFMYGRESFLDLGEWKGSALPSWDDIPTGSNTPTPDAWLKDGHLYFFQLDYVNGTDIELLFLVERL